MREGFVHSTRGRGGGLRLARPAEEINLGQVLRRSEAGGGPAECLRSGGKVTCVLAPICELPPILAAAREAFFVSLDQKTLADALPRRELARQAMGLLGDVVSGAGVFRR